MKLELLEEPELEFGNSGRHIDIRFGIKANGPVSEPYTNHCEQWKCP